MHYYRYSSWHEPRNKHHADPFSYADPFISMPTMHDSWVVFISKWKMGMEIRGTSPMSQRWQMAEPEFSGLHMLDHF